VPEERCSGAVAAAATMLAVLRVVGSDNGAEDLVFNPE
jgi:hypothetical protein